MRILAVDDEPYILELMPLLAARVGFPDVTTASSAGFVLETLLNEHTIFDCFVLDINMPGMDGIELCGRIRQIPAYRKTPIIMLTAMSEREFMDAAFKAGATDYTTKPFDIHELGARLRVAHELVLARQTSEKTRASEEASGQASHRRHPFGIAEAIALDGLSGLVDFHSFKNYLKQISRAGLAASQIIAVKVDQIEDVYNQAKAEEFTYALCEVAGAVVETMQTKGCLISYAGNGVFVVVSNSAAPLAARDIESDVQHMLDERNAAFDSGNPMDIEVSIGTPVRPNFGDLADVPRAVERAVARALDRSASKHHKPRGVNISKLGP
jgi:CheY-like chemotaxis protein